MNMNGTRTLLFGLLSLRGLIARTVFTLFQTVRPLNCSSEMRTTKTDLSRHTSETIDQYVQILRPIQTRTHTIKHLSIPVYFSLTTGIRFMIMLRRRIGNYRVNEWVDTSEQALTAEPPSDSTTYWCRRRRLVFVIHPNVSHQFLSPSADTAHRTPTQHCTRMQNLIHKTVANSKFCSHQLHCLRFIKQLHPVVHPHSFTAHHKNTTTAVECPNTKRCRIGFRWQLTFVLTSKGLLCALKYADEWEILVNGPTLTFLSMPNAAPL